MPNILNQKQNGVVVRTLTEIEKPVQGQECIVRWTNCNNQYDAPCLIAGVNKSSVGVTLLEDVPYPPHYGKDTPAYRRGHHIRVPKWPQATHNNGVFAEVKA